MIYIKNSLDQRGYQRRVPWNKVWESDKLSICLEYVQASPSAAVATWEGQEAVAIEERNAVREKYKS